MEYTEAPVEVCIVGFVEVGSIELKVLVVGFVGEFVGEFVEGFVVGEFVEVCAVQGNAVLEYAALEYVVVHFVLVPVEVQIPEV